MESAAIPESDRIASRDGQAARRKGQVGTGGHGVIRSERRRREHQPEDRDRQPDTYAAMGGSTANDAVVFFSQMIAISNGRRWGKRHWLRSIASRKTRANRLSRSHGTPRSGYWVWNRVCHSWAPRLSTPFADFTPVAARQISLPARHAIHLTDGPTRGTSARGTCARRGRTVASSPRPTEKELECADGPSCCRPCCCLA